MKLGNGIIVSPFGPFAHRKTILMGTARVVCYLTARHGYANGWTE